MAKKQVVKELEIVGGKWVSSERSLNEAGDDELIFERLTLRSQDQSKRMTLFLDNDGVPKLMDDESNEFRLLTVGINSQSGEVVFDNSKSVRVDFVRNFKNTPAISITLDDPSNSPPYRYYPGITGFTIRFSNKFTGIVQWQAMES